MTNSENQVKNVWKIGTRWTPNGTRGSSIFQSVFCTTGFAFSYTDNCKEISEGDLLAFADGYHVVAVGKALSPGALLKHFDYSRFDLKIQEFFLDPNIYGCKVKIIHLNESDSFEYKKMGMFYNARSKADDIKRLYEKYTQYDFQEKEDPQNLFYWANKELAQDSFLCWLLSHASSSFSERENDPMKRIAFDFLIQLLKKISPQNEIITQEMTIEVKIHKQFKNIDLVAEVKFGSKRIAIVIEDKVTASVYNIIENYVKSVKNHFSLNEEEVFSIIVRTGDEAEVSTNNENNIKYFLREDFLELFNKHPYACTTSEILSDFYQHIKTIEFEIKGYVEKEIGVWTKEWSAWKGFYSCISKHIPSSRWEYVPNASGGFLCCLTSSKIRTISNLTLCWQIESDKKALCLKLGEVYSNHSNVRDFIVEKFYDYLSRNNLDETLFPKPKRFGCGCYMTIILIPSDILLGDNSKTVNMQTLLNYLRKTDDILDGFVQQLNNSNDLNKLEELLN